MALSDKVTLAILICIATCGVSIVVGIVLIATLAPMSSAVLLIPMLVGFAVPTITSLLTLLKTQETSIGVGDVIATSESHTQQLADVRGIVNGQRERLEENLAKLQEQVRQLTEQKARVETLAEASGVNIEKIKPGQSEDIGVGGHVG